VLDPLGPDARAAAAALLLVALPGLTLVRSPWRAMPALSLAFWTLTWAWAGPAPRTRFLHAALAVLATLAVLRVLRPGPLPRPRRAHLALAAAVVGAIVPLAVLPVAPGARMPLESLAAELLGWRDGWPASFEPLLPVRPFRASGLSALAADVSLLSGAAPHRATVAAAAAASALLVLGCWWIAAWRDGPARAGAVAVAAAAVLAASAGSGPGVLAAAFVVHAAILWLDRRGTPSAFAAGACLAAGLAADPATAAVLALAVPLLVAPLRARAPDGRRRARVVLGTALALVLPLAVHPPPLAPLEAAPLVAVALVVALAGAWPMDAKGSPGRMAVTVAVVAGAAVFVIASPERDGQGPAAGDLAAMIWVRDHARPLDVVCAPDVPAARWIPAVAARPSAVPVVPGGAAAAGPCAVWLALSGRDAPGHPPWAPSFRSGSAAVWTASQPR
jgi:hypothetical protein